MCIIELVKSVVAKTTWYQHGAKGKLVEHLRRFPPSLLVESSSKILLPKILLQYIRRNNCFWDVTPGPRWDSSLLQRGAWEGAGFQFKWLIDYHSDWFQ
jgi:hypothetical protein